MKVLKFGGTSVGTSEHIKALIPLIKKDEPIIQLIRKCKDEGIYGANFSENIVIFANLSEKGRKSIARYKTGICEGTEIIGYFKNPYESRIAVLVSKWSPGWEGPPSIITYTIIGCHLEKGFR